MQLNDEMQSLIRHELKTFSHRAIARELHDMLLNAKTPGECALQTQEWAQEWNTPEGDIWSVIDFMSQQGLWTVDQGRMNDTLRAAHIKSSAGAIKKRGKRIDMGQIRQVAQSDRSKAIGLSDVLPGAVSEICKKIPLLERNKALDEGYVGWLPTDRYGLDGTAFVVNPGMMNQWQEDFPEVDIPRALELMFDDLKVERMERPKPATFPYWVRTWLKRNGEAVANSADDDISVDTQFEVEY